MLIRKKIIIGILLIVASSLLFLFFLFPSADDLTGYEVTPITKSGKNIYIKKKIWGMTADHQVIVISKSGRKKFEVDSTKDYAFYGSMPLFFRQQGDTLFIYTRKIVKVPADFNSSFSIIQIELSNPEMMRLIENDSYKKEGLQIIGE